MDAQTEAGLPRDKLVAAHGNFDSATCISTGQPVPIEEVREAIMGEDREGWQRLRDRYGGLVRAVKSDSPLPSPSPLVSRTRKTHAVATGSPPSAPAAMDPIASPSPRRLLTAPAQVKPDIVFFGERLPERFYRLAGAPPAPPRGRGASGGPLRTIGCTRQGEGGGGESQASRSNEGGREGGEDAARTEGRGGRR